jgi:hypothetical protein
MDCGFVILYCKIAAGNTAERYLQESPVWSPWLTEINGYVAFLSSGERKINHVVEDQVSLEGAAKW